MYRYRCNITKQCACSEIQENLEEPYNSAAEGRPTYHKGSGSAFHREGSLLHKRQDKVRLSLTLEHTGCKQSASSSLRYHHLTSNEVWASACGRGTWVTQSLQWVHDTCGKSPAQTSHIIESKAYGCLHQAAITSISQHFSQMCDDLELPFSITGYSVNSECFK